LRYQRVFPRLNSPNLRKSQMVRWEVDAIITDIPSRWLELRSALESNVHIFVVLARSHRQGQRTTRRRRLNTVVEHFSTPRSLFIGQSLMVSRGWQRFGHGQPFCRILIDFSTVPFAKMGRAISSVVCEIIRWLDEPILPCLQLLYTCICRIFRRAQI
jgi:hypothetical protein